MTGPTHPEDLAEVVHTDTEFEAHAKAAVLHEAGIEAEVITDGPSWAGMIKLSRMEAGAGVWVRRDDLEAAREALEQSIADSVDLDWDEVDVGESEEALERRTSAGMPAPAKLAWFVALLMLLCGLLLGIVMFFG